MTTTPHIAPAELRPALEAMLRDLDCFELHVGLIPAPEQRHRGHFVRMVFGHNPGWYRELCETYQRRRVRKVRYVDPLFKRADVAAVIRLLLTKGSRSYLAWPLLAIAKCRNQDFDADSEWAPADLPFAAPAHVQEASHA